MMHSRFKDRPFIHSAFRFSLLIFSVLITGALPQQCTAPSGKGVTIAILDRGIDWEHPDFINANGTTRIKAMFDMSSSREYTEAQINAALAGGPRIGMNDGLGHGTVTAGVAAGNGRAVPSLNGKYAGVAPNADLVIVKVDVAEFAGNYVTALEWAAKKIELLNQPAVLFINAGTQYGPIDGTSAVSRKIDALFGPDKPGKIVVAPSGDEGTLPNHAAASVFANALVDVAFDKTSTQSPVTLQAWYSSLNPVSIEIDMDSGVSIGPIFPGDSQSSLPISIINYPPGYVHPYHLLSSTSGDGLILLSLNGSLAGSGKIRIRGLGTKAGNFHLYSDVSGSLTSTVKFKTHLAPGRLSDFASTRSAIVVGASVASTYYLDIDGNAQNSNTEGLSGQLWMKSSPGPWRNASKGVWGVDIVAQAHNIFAAYAQGSEWAKYRTNLIYGGKGFYGKHGATSAAAPLLAGTIALMLELNPALTTNEVRDILRITATKDANTGVVPNYAWGFGKLNKTGALNEVVRRLESKQ